MTANNWSGGYLTEDTYTAAYYSSQEPGVLQSVCLLQQVAWSVPREGGVYVEVGCGRGYTACTIAAANPSWTVIAIDYMPAHIAEAREFAAEAGLQNITFHELDLSEVGPADAAQLVPEADIVTLHGVWSWVSDAVQDGILEILNRLKPGGVAMVSYNALPGWSDGLGMQRLVHLLAANGAGRPQDRVGAAMGAVKKLQDNGARAFANSVHVKAQLGLAEQGSALTYVAHEMLNDHWRAFFVHEVWRRMARAKLDYVGSSALVDNFLPFQLTPEQRAVVDELPPGPARELATDLVTNRQFRRDIFVRGRRPLSPGGAWRDLPFIRTSDAPIGKVTFSVPVGDAEVPEETLVALSRALDDGPRTLGDLLSLPETSRMSPWELLPTIMGANFARPMWREAPGPDSMAAEIARRFNVVASRRFLADDKALSALALAAPCLGAGLEARSPEMAVAAALIAHQESDTGSPPPNEVVLARQLLRPDAPSDAVVEAESSIREMLRLRVPVWRRLGLLR